MSKVLSFDLEFEHDYKLIGIHSSLEDYRMAYFLNQSLEIQLKRYPEDLDFESQKGHFSVYEYTNRKNNIDAYLISNKFLQINDTNANSDSLFPQESRFIYLIPEKKQVDYFLKIQGLNMEEFLQQTVEKINKTFQVITAYLIDPYDLRSRDHLIF